jgi:cell division septal protein FtsQ
VSSEATPEPGRAHPALDRRRREVARDRGRKRRRIVLAAIGGAVCALAGYWLATGPVLTIYNVHLVGYAGPDANQLRSAISSVASQGGSLISPPVGDITQVAERFPGVQTVHISRDWPLGLKVTVTPAAPAAIVRAPGQVAVVVSNRGLVMGLVPRRLVRASMILTPPIPAFGQPLPGWAMDALAFLEALTPGTRNRVQDLTLSQGQLTGQLSDGPALVLGTLDRLAEKAAAINAVLLRVSRATQRQATYLDVTVPDRPALGSVGASIRGSSTSSTG